MAPLFRLSAPISHITSVWRNGKEYGAFSNLAGRQIEEPTGPDAPSPHGQGNCPSGWGCLTRSQQSGIIFSIVVFVVGVLAALFYCP